MQALARISAPINGRTVFIGLNVLLSATRLKLRSAAIALSALLDGLWVELSLSSETFKPSEAIGICEDWVNALCAGAFPRILREKHHRT